MRKRIFILACAIVALAMPSLAQTSLPAASLSGSTLTFSCPSPATGAQVWRAAGNTSTVTLTSSNWVELGTSSTASGSYSDTTGVNGTQYGYTVICTEGSLIAAPTPIYFGTPSAPLAAGTLSGTTS